MRKLFFLTILMKFIINLEQDGHIAKEELDNYTVYLMSNYIDQNVQNFKEQCPGGF